jgi:hypothetical protein
MASVVVNGDVSGSVTLQAPSAAGSVTVTLPAASGTMASLASVTANGVAYINSSSQPTSGSALVFDGTNFSTTGTVGSTGNAAFGGGSVPVASGFQYGIGVGPNGLIGTRSAGNDYRLLIGTNSKLDGTYRSTSSQPTSVFTMDNGITTITVYPAGTAGNAYGTATATTTFDASGNLLVGTTTAGAGGTTTRLAVDGGAGEPSVFKTSSGSGAYCARMWNSATTTNNAFIGFLTETVGTERGAITYNRGAGLVAYGTTSDYRAKDISGPVVNSGELIDSIHVYMGTMKGATQERPMFIAHETPAYAHSGEKDAVDKNGNPVYQQMDTSALVPVMWAEIQSLRKRLAALESA